MKWEQRTETENFEVTIIIQTKSIIAHSKLTQNNRIREMVSDGLSAIADNVKDYFNTILVSEGYKVFNSEN